MEFPTVTWRNRANLRQEPEDSVQDQYIFCCGMEPGTWALWASALLLSHAPNPSLVDSRQALDQRLTFLKPSSFFLFPCPSRLSEYFPPKHTLCSILILDVRKIVRKAREK